MVGGVAYEEKPVDLEAIVNETHLVFVQRVRDEMKNQQLSDNELAKRCKQKGFPIGQSSISRLTRGKGGKNGPTIANIHAIARGLDREAWQLFKLAEGAKVLPLPIPSRPIHDEPDRQESRLSPRRKRRR